MGDCQGVGPGAATIHFVHGLKKWMHKKLKAGVKNFSYIRNALRMRSMTQKNNYFADRALRKSLEDRV
jgi:hypothetical protein